VKAKIVLPIAISILLFSLVSGTRFVERGAEVTSAVNSGQGFPSGLGESSVDWWPMFHHDLTHTGYSTSTAPTTNQTPWNYRTGSWVASSPAVVDDVIYVGSGDNNVYALNATTGRKVWNYTTGNCVQWSSPAVVGGVVYVGSTDNKIYALNAATGTTVWNYATAGEVWSSPAVVGGVVYVGSWDGNVYALSTTTGTLVWKTTGWPVVSSPAVVGGVVYVGSTDNKIYALNAATGTTVWNYATGGAVWSSPAVVGGVVYVGSNDGNVYALNAATGTTVWNYATGGAVWSSPAVVDGRVYVGSDDNKTYCLNASTGAHIWDYTTGDVVESSPAVAAGIVYVGSNDHNVYALNAVAGTLVWSFRTSDSVFSSPAVVHGVVYVGSLDGHIYAGRSIDVYLWNSIEPAPMGIADYGIGPSGPYEYATKSFVGTVTIASLLTNRSSDYIVSFQLNVEFEFNTSHGQHVFWMQNTATVITFGSILTLENFGSNVWNWSKFFAQIDPSGISGKGQFGTPQDPYGYVCTRDGIFTPFNRTTPITITLNVTSGVSPSGEPTVSFAYDIGDGLITYDTITFTNVTGLTSSSFKVTGFGLNPAGVFCNAALILGGFLVTTDVLSDVQLQLEYWNGHNYQVVPNAYNFGTNTAETIDNVLCGFSHYPGNGKIFAEILPGAGQLGELYNQSQTGAIDIISPLASGTLYVTNASDPNATAWKIPFVSGEVTVTLYPGYYNLQLYNQYGKLFDQGNFTVSAGQALYLQTPLGPATHNIAAINAASAKTVIGEGFNASINITVANQGSYPETFNVTVYVNTTIIETKEITLTSGASTTINFTWNTSGFVKGNYTIKAIADTVLGEIDTEDNTLINGIVTVTISGDVDGNFKVQLADLVILAKAYGSKLGDSNWNPNADIDGNSVVGLSDLVILANHYGQQFP